MTDYEPQDRNRWFSDEDGARATTKREDEAIAVPIDWSDALADISSTETISSVTYVDSGVTRSSTSNTTTATTTIVTGLGEFEITVVTSGGKTLQRVRRFYSPVARSAVDYR